MHNFGAGSSVDVVDVVDVSGERTKKCKDCGETKPIVEFYVNPKSGPQACCKPCAVNRAAAQRKANPELARRRSREWVRRNPDKRRANHDRWKYGVPVGFRQTLWASQHGCCAICGTAITAEAGHIDHDHTTNRIRGMLCWGCNKGLGAFKDSIENLTMAAGYLQSTQDLRDLAVEGVTS